MANLLVWNSLMQAFHKALSLASFYSSFSLITQDLSNSSTLYADDVTLIAFIKSEEERGAVDDSLNQDLTKIKTRTTSWNVLFGAAKCMTVTISNCRGARDIHTSLWIFGITLIEVENVELYVVLFCAKTQTQFLKSEYHFFLDSIPL